MKATFMRGVESGRNRSLGSREIRIDCVHPPIPLVFSPAPLRPPVLRPSLPPEGMIFRGSFTTWCPSACTAALRGMSGITGRDTCTCRSSALTSMRPSASCHQGNHRRMEPNTSSGDVRKEANTVLLHQEQARSISCPASSVLSREDEEEDGVLPGLPCFTRGEVGPAEGS